MRSYHEQPHTASLPTEPAQGLVITHKSDREVIQPPSTLPSFSQHADRIATMLEQRKTNADKLKAWKERFNDPRQGLYDEELVNERPLSEAWKGQIQVYAHDVIIKRTWQLQGQVGGGDRKEITGLSKASRQRLMFTARNLEGLTHFLTATYPKEFPTDGETVKRQMANLRKWLVRRGVGGLWFLEFQERGAPHFHVLCNGYINRYELSEAWSKIIGLSPCPHCVRTQVQYPHSDKIRVQHTCTGGEGGRGCDYCKSVNAGTQFAEFDHKYAAASYASKESAKMAQKRVPEGFERVGRFWACFGYVRLRAKIVLGGTVRELAHRMRLLRRMIGKCEEWDKAFSPRASRDNGRYSKKLWDIGQAVLKYAGELLGLDHQQHAPPRAIGEPYITGMQRLALAERQFSLFPCSW